MTDNIHICNYLTCSVSSMTRWQVDLSQLNINWNPPFQNEIQRNPTLRHIAENTAKISARPPPPKMPLTLDVLCTCIRILLFHAALFLYSLGSVVLSLCHRRGARRASRKSVAIKIGMVPISATLWIRVCAPTIQNGKLCNNCTVITIDWTSSFLFEHARTRLSRVLDLVRMEWVEVCGSGKSVRASHYVRGKVARIRDAKCYWNIYTHMHMYKYMCVCVCACICTPAWQA